MGCLLPKASKRDSAVDRSPTEPSQHQKATPIAVAINSFTVKLQRHQQRQFPEQFAQAAASQALLSTLAYILLNQSSNRPSSTAHPPQPLTKASLPPAPWSPHQCVPMPKRYPVIPCSPYAVFKSLGLHLRSSRKKICHFLCVKKDALLCNRFLCHHSNFALTIFHHHTQQYSIM